MGLTQYDVEEVCAACNDVFSQGEVEILYWRFRSLDRGRKGFVTSEEFLAIPELSINPLAQRLVRMLDGCNFKDFVRFLASFSPRASREAKLRFIFDVYDVDGDGIISRDDLATMMRYLVGSQLNEEQISALLDRCLKETRATSSISYDAFLKSSTLLNATELSVKIPHRL